MVINLFLVSFCPHLSLLLTLTSCIFFTVCSTCDKTLVGVFFNFFSSPFAALTHSLAPLFYQNEIYCIIRFFLSLTLLSDIIYYVLSLLQEALKRKKEMGKCCHVKQHIKKDEKLIRKIIHIFIYAFRF